jgi:E3 ubiquitin-protein ligase UBR1
MKNYEFLDEDVEESMDVDVEDTEEEFHSANEETPVEMQVTDDFALDWTHPTGTCIVCQEDMDRSGAYGMLGLVQPSIIMRFTPTTSADAMTDVFRGLGSLDVDEPQALLDLLEAVPSVQETPTHTTLRRPGLYASSCGHLMHFHCFEEYTESLRVRHMQQPTRNHPEDLSKKEFLCPLCKSLGNVLIPMQAKERRERAWKSKLPFDEWLKTVDMAQQFRTNSNHQPGQAFDGPDYEMIASNIAARMFDNSVVDSESPRFRGAMAHFITDIVRPPAQMRMDSVRPPEWTTQLVTDIVGNFFDAPVIEATKKMYLKVGQAMRTVWKDADIEWLKHVPCDPSVQHTDLLVDVFSYTIAAVEISLRGRDGSGSGSTIGVVECMSETTSAFLKILAEMVSTYYMLASSASASKTEFVTKSFHRLQSLFYAQPAELEPILTQDAFLVLSEWAFHVLTPYKMDFMHMVRMMHTVELVRITVALIEALLQAGKDDTLADWTMLAAQHSLDDNDAEEELAIHGLFQLVTRALCTPSDASKVMEAVAQVPLAALVHQFALPYLRRTALLARTKYGLDLLGGDFTLQSSEFHRLRARLCIPETSILLVELDEQGALSTHFASWIRHYRQHQQLATAEVQAIYLNHPVYFRLLPLTQRLDVLLDWALRQTCKKCNTIPYEPALCLACGTLVCSQSFCCSDEDLGECNIHAATHVPYMSFDPSRCGGGIGMFILLRKCVLLMLNRESGSFQPAPYLDEHGEADLGLKYAALCSLTWLDGVARSSSTRNATLKSAKCGSCILSPSLLRVNWNSPTTMAGGTHSNSKPSLYATCVACILYLHTRASHWPGSLDVLVHGTWF